MIAIPEREQLRIAKELREESVVYHAKQLEDLALTKADNDYKLAIHILSRWAITGEKMLKDKEEQQ